MSHQWTLGQRHCLHIMATHYPESTWIDRGTIFNHVFTVSLAYDKVRDEYGGHKNGRRNMPNGVKPTRSLMWNDDVCRDEFHLPGPYTQEQAQVRRDMLRRIQRSINDCGLSTNQGLMAINMIPGCIRADNNSPAGGALAAQPAANVPAPASSSATTTLAGQSASSSSATADNTADSTSTDPALGGRAWYHTQEITKVGERFVYRAVPNLSRSVVPAETWKRLVEFSPTVTRSVQVCDQGRCMVCRRDRPIRAD
jgi:hypothetical protein